MSSNVGEKIFDNPEIDDEDPEFIIGNLNDNSYLNEIKKSILNIITEINNNEDDKNYTTILEKMKLIYNHIFFYYSLIEKIIEQKFNILNKNKDSILTNNVVYRRKDFIICLDYLKEKIEEVNEVITIDKIDKIPIKQRYLFSVPLKNLSSLKDKINILKNNLQNNLQKQNETSGGKRNKITKRQLKITKRRFKNKKTKRRFPRR
jgi:hypothetical protein